MGTVIDFNEFYMKKKDAERLKALCEGKVEVYTCNGCGRDFEVVDDNFPEVCPCCGVPLAW